MLVDCFSNELMRSRVCTLGQLYGSIVGPWQEKLTIAMYVSGQGDGWGIIASVLPGCPPDHGCPGL